MSTKLSKEQIQAVDAVCGPIMEAALSTAPIDRDQSRAAIAAAYTGLDLALPELLFVDSPLAAFRVLEARAGAGGSAGPSADPAALALLQQMGLPADVLGMMGGALPRADSPLGAEVDLSFHDAHNLAMDPCFDAPLWRGLSNRVERKVGAILGCEHAVQGALSAALSSPASGWLVYSGGAASLWSAAESIARVGALHAIGLIARLPEEHALALAALGSCGWINAFAQLCVVCDRPTRITLAAADRGGEGDRTELVWRDGSVCTSVSE